MSPRPTSLDRNEVIIPGRVGLRLNFPKTAEAHWRDYGHNRGLLF